MKKAAAAILVFLLAANLALWADASDLDKTTETTKLVVQGVVPKSPAEAAGLQQNDILIEYNGIPAHTVNEVNELKKKVKTDSVDVTVLRDGKKIIFKLPAGQMGVYLKELLPDLKYKKDAVVIDGIPKLDWSTGKSNSFLAAVEVIANHLGIDKDYVYIYGVSGAAFRLHFHKDWCPSSPDPTCGYNSGEQALKVLGLKYHFVHIPEDDTTGRQELRKNIMESIDKGMPVIAIDLINVPEWGIITGYQTGGEELICRTYFDRREGYDIADKFPWVVCFIDSKSEIPTDIDNYKKSFAIALENLTTPEYKAYGSGLAGFDKWLERLKTDDFAAMDSTEFVNASHSNAWIYDRLVEDRDFAVQYLERIASEFPELTEKLNTLAKLYREESELLKPSKDVIMYQFNMKSRDDWSPEMRKEAVLRLKKAKAKEEEALKIWKQIVAL